MRSRYSAFCVGDTQYLNTTHHPSQRIIEDLALASSIANTQWHGLRIIEATQREDSNEGFVEFIASYSEGNQPGALHEKSRFVKEDNHWLYIDGEILESGPSKLPSRNEPCWCGSGKKFKKCHG